MFARVISLYGFIIVTMLALSACNNADFAGSTPSKNISKPKTADGKGNTNPNGSNTGWNDTYVDANNDGIDDITGKPIPMIDANGDGKDDNSGKPIVDSNGDGIDDNTGRPIITGVGDLSGSAGLTLVALKVGYDGSNAGDDSQFTYYIQRVSPSKQTKMREIIKSAKSTYRDGQLDQTCVCGQTTKLRLYWHHISDSAWSRGSLHGFSNGEWMVSKTPPSSWKNKLSDPFPENSYTVFMGADLENPAFIANPIGLGYFRTTTFHPNSPLDARRVWETRDDMRFAYSCDVDACPADKKSSTNLEFEYHPSMAAP